MEITYQSNFVPAAHFVLDLYHDAEWVSYTENEEKLIRALNHSLCVITAWEDTDLVGLVRAVGDGETILYIQDILVRKSHRRNGIGRRLIELLLSKYPDVRQKVLLTGDDPDTRTFYEHIGFSAIDTLPYNAFIQLDPAKGE